VEVEEVERVVMNWESAAKETKKQNLIKKGKETSETRLVGVVKTWPVKASAKNNLRDREAARTRTKGKGGGENENKVRPIPPYNRKRRLDQRCANESANQIVGKPTSIARDHVSIAPSAQTSETMNAARTPDDPSLQKKKRH